MSVPEINGVRIGKHGVRHEGKYYPAWYSLTGADMITIYARKHCPGLPKALGEIENNSEMQSDYFEKDKVRLRRGTPAFEVMEKFMQGAAAQGGVSV